jgi:hypothetical protein
LANLGVFQVLLIRDSSAIRDLSHESRKFLIDDVFNFFVVMSLDFVAMSLLVVDEVVDFISLRHAGNEVGLLHLHVVQNSVDVHISWLKVWSSLNKGLGELLACFLVSSIPDITFPKAEDFADQVVFEELHGR